MATYGVALLVFHQVVDVPTFRFHLQREIFVLTAPLYLSTYGLLLFPNWQLVVFQWIEWVDAADDYEVRVMV